MYRKTLVCLAVSVLIAVMLSVRGTSRATVPLSLMVPNPVVFEAAGGVAVALRAANQETKQFRFEVCGQDVTRLPAGLSIAFVFDATIHHIVVRDARTRMAIGARVAGNIATVSLTRDPFMPLQPWRVAVRIDLKSVPETGRIAVGPIEAYDVMYRVVPTSEHSAAERGTGCVDLLASGWRYPHAS